MSNKVLALVILLCSLWILIWGYFYFFVFYGAKVTFNGDIEQYTITLSSKSLKKDLQYTCEQSSCSYEKIPPLNFQIRILKEGYEDFIVQKKIQWKWNQNIEFTLKEKTQTVNIKLWAATTEEVIDEKRVRLKYKRFFLYYDFGDRGVFYIREYLWKLFLYRDLKEKEVLIY